MKEVKFNMKGIINYDTDNSCIEFAGFIFRKTVIENPRILFYNCRLLNVVMIQTHVHDCVVSGSDLDKCETNNSKFKDSRIKNSENTYAEFKNCYLDGVNVINSYIDGGIFRKGSHSNTEISEKTIIIDKDVENLDEKED
tara:strand:- start:142 stop:561 length:420 start_codon:yes stop_codon:yes gene_type:complete